MAAHFGDIVRGIHQSDSPQITETSLGQLKIILDVLKYHRTPQVRLTTDFFFWTLRFPVSYWPSSSIAHLSSHVCLISGAI